MRNINGIDYPGKLIESLQPGKKIRIWGGLYHVRGVIDDDQIVLRVWNKRKQCWVYSVVWMYRFLIAAGLEKSMI